MRASRVALFLSLALVTLSGLLLLGCGGADETTTTTTAAPAADTTTTVESTTSTTNPLYEALPPAIKDAGVIKFVGDSHPPYRVVAQDGTTVTGIDKDMQDALSAVLGIPIEMEITTGLPAMLAGMLSGRYDAFNGPVKDNVEREKDFDAIAWMVTRTSYLVPNTLSAEIKETADLAGRKVAGTTGSIVEDQVKKLNEWLAANGKEPVEFIGLADTNSTLLAVKAGRADAASMTEAAAIDAMGKEKDTFFYVKQTDEQGAGVDQLALLVPKASGLGPVMFDAFKAIFANGEYKRIMDLHGLENVAVTEPLFNPAAGQ